ncbi:MAG: transposase [Nitrospirae bacterium]|nr:transposase [Nitrospirota bacterium]
MIAQTVFPFKLDTSMEKLTAHGGLALMAEFNHGIGIMELTNKYLPHPQSNRGFMPAVFVDPLVLMLEGGGVSLEDIRELKYEDGLMKLIGETKIPSPDAIGDWLRRMGEESEGLWGLDKVRERATHRLLKRDGIKEYTLDADATEIIAEKDEANYTYKGNKGYMPMLGFLYEAKLCIYDEFREGNTPPAFGQKDFYTECKKRMPKGKKIKAYRADSASYQAELINRLGDNPPSWRRRME